MNARLFYFTIYHSQTDDQSKRINQTIEIVLRFVISLLNNSVDWSNLLSKIQRAFNNNVSNTDYTSNETIYDFISTQSDLVSQSTIDQSVNVVDVRVARRIIRVDIVNVIILDQMFSKAIYDRKHQFLFMKIDDWVLFRLHKDYNISFIARLDKKFSQQFVDLFQIVEKIDRLAYKLIISKNWRVYSIFIVAQLKSVSSLETNSFNRSRSIESNFVYVKNDIKQIKSWEIKRFFNKRQIARREVEYLVKWKKWNSKHDVWKNFSKLNNVMNLIKKYEKIYRDATSLVRLVDSKFFADTKFLVTKFSISKLFDFFVIMKKFFANFRLDVFKSFVVVIFRKFFAIQNSIVISSTVFSSNTFFSIIFFSTSLISSISFDAMMLRRFARLKN